MALASGNISIAQKLYIKKYLCRKILPSILLKKLQQLVFETTSFITRHRDLGRSESVSIPDKEIRVSGTVEAWNKCGENFSNSRNDAFSCAENSSQAVAVPVPCSMSTGTYSSRLFSRDSVFAVDSRKACTKSTVYFTYFIHRWSCFF